MTAGRRDQLAEALWPDRSPFRGRVTMSRPEGEALDRVEAVVDRMIRQAQAEAVATLAVELAEDARVSAYLRNRAAEFAASSVTTDRSVITQRRTANRPESPAIGPGGP